MANSRRRRSRGADWFIARLLVVLSLFAAFVFAVSVISTGMLPLKFVLVVIAALVLLVLLVALLTWNPRYRVRYVLGLILEKKEEILEADIEKLIEERQAARKAKDFARADAIRGQLLDMGIVLLDTREGVKWKKA